jgi:hypothetical protein
MMATVICEGREVTEWLPGLESLSRRQEILQSEMVSHLHQVTNAALFEGAGEKWLELFEQHKTGVIGGSLWGMMPFIFDVMRPRIAVTEITGGLCEIRRNESVLVFKLAPSLKFIQGRCAAGRLTVTSTFATELYTETAVRTCAEVGKLVDMDTFCFARMTDVYATSMVSSNARVYSLIGVFNVRLDLEVVEADLTPEITIVAEGRRFFLRHEDLRASLFMAMKDVGNLDNFDVVRHLYFRHFDLWNFHALMQRVDLINDYVIDDRPRGSAWVNRPEAKLFIYSL